jgi:hypothetical protein
MATDPLGPRVRRLGGAHFVAAGAVTLATGLALCYAGVSQRLLWAVVASGERYVSSVAFLRDGYLFARLATEGAVLAGLALLVLGAASVYGGWLVVADRPSRGRLASGASLLNPLALPLVLVGAALVGLSRRYEYDGEPDRG